MIETPRMEVLVGTANPGKIREIAVSMLGVPIRLRYLEEFQGISPAEEIGTSYEENAILKAMSYSKQTGISALTDDSGLEVDALSGLPGVRSARYGGDGASDEERTKKLLRAIVSHPVQQRTARFVCCMALAGWALKEARSGDNEPALLHVGKGKCEGQIVFEPRGKNGFGYDPIFVPSGYELTFGELPSTIKNTISHRAQALADMRGFFDRWIT